MRSEYGDILPFPEFEMLALEHAPYLTNVKNIKPLLV
jgi:hypothetical protein